jgi:hypothetical protein
MRHQSTSRRPTMDGFAPGVGSGLPSPAVGRSLRASCPSLTACPLRFALRASLAPTARPRGSAAPHNRDPYRCPFVAHASRRANAGGSARSCVSRREGLAPGVGSGLPSPTVGRSLRASCPSLTACPLRFALRASLAPTARRRGSAAPHNRDPYRCPFVAHASRRANAASIDLATCREELPRPVVDRSFVRDSKCFPSRSSVRRLRKSAA